MDAQAAKTRELVVEACAQIEALQDLAPLGAAGDLEHVRALLLALAEETGDEEAVDAAWGVVADIDAALESLDLPLMRRGAA